MIASFRALLALSLAVLVLGHGRLIDPPSRNSAWRYGFKTPRQDTDNELNCGGFNVQWSTNKGKCGVCGDAYHLRKHLSLYVFPGKYATGTITRTYKEGQTIEVLVDVTSNHQGHFTFSVGDIGTAPITKEKLTHVLKQPSGETKWRINSRGNDLFKIKLVLPKGLTCEHCVMQWWWRVGNNWGCDSPGDCGMGKGEQETFVNCADIKITKGDGSVPLPPPTKPPPPTEKPPPPTTQKPTEPLPTNAPNPSGCKARSGRWQSIQMDDWCQRNCAMGYCPDQMCYCH